MVLCPLFWHLYSSLVCLAALWSAHFACCGVLLARLGCHVFSLCSTGLTLFIQAASVKSVCATTGSPDLSVSKLWSGTFIGSPVGRLWKGSLKGASSSFCYCSYASVSPRSPSRTRTSATESCRSSTPKGFRRFRTSDQLGNGHKEEFVWPACGVGPEPHLGWPSEAVETRGCTLV